MSNTQKLPMPSEPQQPVIELADGVYDQYVNCPDCCAVLRITFNVNPASPEVTVLRVKHLS